MRSWLLVLLLAGGGTGAFAQDAPLSWGHAVPVEPDVAAQVRDVIGRQLDAFQHHDADAAYVGTAPNVRRSFPTPEAFMAMAQRNYAPLLRWSATRYTSIRGGAATPTHAETWSQTSTILTRDGETWTATYGIERQPDGTLKITSCVIVRSAAGAA